MVNGHSKQAVLLTAGEFPIIVYSDIATNRGAEEQRRAGGMGAAPSPMSRFWSPRRSPAKPSIPAAAQTVHELSGLAMKDRRQCSPWTNRRRCLSFSRNICAGLKFFPADWTLSDTFEEYNKTLSGRFFGKANDAFD